MRGNETFKPVTNETPGMATLRASATTTSNTGNSHATAIHAQTRVLQAQVAPWLLPDQFLSDHSRDRGREHVDDPDGQKGNGVYPTAQREEAKRKSPGQTVSQQEEQENFSNSHRVT